MLPRLVDPGKLSVEGIDRKVELLLPDPKPGELDRLLEKFDDELPRLRPLKLLPDERRKAGLLLPAMLLSELEPPSTVPRVVLATSADRLIVPG